MNVEDESYDGSQLYSTEFYHRLMQSAVREWLKRHGYSSTRRAFDQEMSVVDRENIFKERAKLVVLLNMEGICHTYGKKFPGLALLDMLVYHYTNLESDPVFFLSGGKKLFLGSRFKVSRSKKKGIGKKREFSDRYEWKINKNADGVQRNESPPTPGLRKKIPKEFSRLTSNDDDFFGHSSVVSVQKRNPPVEKKDHLSRPKYIPTRDKSPSKAKYTRKQTEEPEISPIFKRLNQNNGSELWSSRSYASIDVTTDREKGVNSKHSRSDV